MGFNTTIVILNDGLDQIRKDTALGESLYQGVLTVDRNGGVDVSAGNHCNAIRVVETHHADSVSLIAVGGNTAQVISHYVCGAGQMFEENTKVEILKALAAELGYRAVKLPERKENT